MVVLLGWTTELFVVGEENRPAVSAAMRSAQASLAALREQRRLERQKIGLPIRTDENGRFLSPSPAPPQISPTLPPHLGWHSPAVTAILQPKNRTANSQTRQLADPPTRRPANSPARQPANQPTCKLYPDVALGMLRGELATAGRIWLLLRHLDAKGQGWLHDRDARQALTQRRSSLRVCGQRQLRNLLEQGEGIFWQRQNGRIWLRSVAKVAAALGVWRLTGRPVALPITALTQGMGKVRAHLYASFHSGRQKGRAQATANPIARETLQQLTHVHPRTQRRYEKQARVQVRANFAVGQPLNSATAQRTAWRHGTAVFHLTDVEGVQGTPGTTYLAWQLPNRYAGPHLLQPRGRQKRINRELADLFMQGMTGNSKGTGEAIPAKRFYAHGKAAVRAFNRQADQVFYWPAPKQNLWHVIEGIGS